MREAVAGSDNRIKVCHVTGPLNVGGAESRLVDLLRHARPNSVVFTFLRFGGEEGKLGSIARDLGAQFIELPVPHNRSQYVPLMASLFREKRFDVLHSHVHLFSGMVMSAAERAGVGTRIVHLRTTSDGRKTTLARMVYRLAMKRLIERHSTNIIAVSESTMEAYSGKGWREDQRKEILYNGFDFHKLVDSNAREAVRAELGIPARARVAIHVGRFAPVKNHAFLVRVAHTVISGHSDTHLVLVGDGELRAEIEALAGALGIDGRVHFVGLRNDIPRLLKSADVFVFPSLWEGLPGAVIEALAAGLPVVASDLPGVREIRAEVGGIDICRNGDVLNFAAAVTRALSAEWQYPVNRERLEASFGMHRYLRRLDTLYGNNVFDLPMDRPPMEAVLG